MQEIAHQLVSGRPPPVCPALAAAGPAQACPGVLLLARLRFIYKV